MEAKAAPKTEEKPEITGDMTIGAVIQKYPDLAEIMLAHGLHCVGCHVQYWETIEQGCQGHGWSDEKIETLIEDLNEALEDL